MRVRASVHGPHAPTGHTCMQHTRASILPRTRYLHTHMIADGTNPAAHMNMCAHPRSTCAQACTGPRGSAPAQRLCLLEHTHTHTPHFEVLVQPSSCRSPVIPVTDRAGSPMAIAGSRQGSEAVQAVQGHAAGPGPDPVTCPHPARPVCASPHTPHSENEAARPWWGPEQPLGLCVSAGGARGG